MRKIFLSILFISTATIAISQTSLTTNIPWTWLSGDSTPNKIEVYGTKGVSSPTNNPGSRNGSANWTDASGNLWLFGGVGSTGQGYHNDVWKYNTATNEWTWVSGDNINFQTGIYGSKGVASVTNKPGSRCFSLSWTDAAGNFWLFGGNGYGEAGTGAGFLNDLWKYSPATNQWTWVSGDKIPNQLGSYGTQNVASLNNKPGARYWTMQGWTDNSGNLWLFGGYGYAVAGGPGYLNDLWKFNPATAEWTWVKGSNVINQSGVYGTKGASNISNTPGARYLGMTWSDAGGQLWLFGGFGYGTTTTQGNLNDLWKFNPSTNEWTWMKGDNLLNVASVYGTMGAANANNKPAGRYWSSTWKDASGYFWLYGGNTGSYPADLWMYNLTTNNWVWASGDNATNKAGVYNTKGVTQYGSKPGSRQGANSWITAAGTLWFFGGEYAPNGGGFTYNDLWKIESSDILVEPTPTARYVNDNSILGDVFTTATGSNANAGSKNAPFATIDFALSIAQIGDTIFVDAGTYTHASISVALNKPITLLGTNYNKAANNSTDLSLINAGRNAESTITGATYNLSASNITLSGFRIVPGIRTGVSASGIVLNNINIHNNLFVLEGTGIFLTGTSTLPLQATRLNITNNRFEPKDTINFSTGLSIGNYKNVNVTNNAFIGKTRSAGQRWMNGFSSGGNTMDSVLVTNNLFDLMSSGFSPAVSSNALFSNNIFERSDLPFTTFWSAASASNIQIKGNRFARNRSNAQLLLRHSGTGGFGISNLNISENIFNHDVATSLSKNYGFIRVEYLNSGTYGVTTIEKNAIRIFGDYAGTTGSYAGIQLQGKHINTTIASNNINFEAINRAPGGVASFPSNTGVLFMTNASATSPTYSSGATLSVLNNTVSGFTNSIATYNSASTPLVPTISYGKLASGVNLTINNNSFTNDSLSINNGDTSQIVTANCNWFGALTADSVISKNSANVAFSPWLTNGSDSSAAIGFQPFSNSCTGVQSGYYVNDNSTTDDVYTNAVGNDANPGTAVRPFATIAKAISAAPVGANIYVDAGTYAQRIFVNKKVNLFGAYANVNPGAQLTRGISETILLPAFNDSLAEIITIQSPGVLLNGFLFDGDNPSLTGNVSLNGVDVNAGMGILTTANEATISNNIFKNFYRYAMLLLPTGHGRGGTVSKNRIDNISSKTGREGRAIGLFSGYGTISDNTLTRVFNGVFVTNISQPSTDSIIVSQNVVGAYNIGINLFGQNMTSSVRVTNNQVSAADFTSWNVPGSSVVNNSTGINVVILKTTDSIVFVNNIIAGTNNGISLNNMKTPKSITIDGGSISNSIGVGVFYIGNDTAKLSMNSVSLFNNNVGIDVSSTSVSELPIEFSGTSITGGSVGLRLYGDKVTVPNNTLSGISFSGQTAQHILLTNNAFTGKSIDATSVTFDGLAGANMTLVQRFAAEDKIVHRVDNLPFGFIRIKSGDVYVTPTSFYNVPPFGSTTTKASVQRAVNSAAISDTVHVAAGTYTGQVVIDKALSVKGAGMGQTIIARSLIDTLTSPTGFNEAGIVQSTTAIGDVFIDDITVDGIKDSSKLLGPTHGIMLQTSGAIRNTEVKNMQLKTTGSPEGNGIYVRYDGITPKSVIVTGNHIHDFTWVGMNVQGNNLTTTITNNEVDATGANYGMGGFVGSLGTTLPNLNFSNNKLKGYNGFGLNVSASNATINNNSFVHIDSVIVRAITNSGPVLSATCNWYGVTAPDSVIALINGQVNYTPWLVDSTDTEVTIGFQPTPNTCTGNELTLVITDSTNVTCNGQGNGSINITVSGGQGAYSYVWSKSGDAGFTSTTEDLTNLSGGVYQVTVTDAIGFIKSLSVTIAEPSLLTGTLNATNVTCNGGANGKIIPQIAGGRLPYTFLWSNQSTGDSLVNVGPGLYSVIVTDSSGCTFEDSVTITQPDSLVIIEVEKFDVDCYGANNGFLAVITDGGTGNHSYLWNNGSTEAYINSLSGGIYSVVITDANGCSITDTFTITEPAVLNASASGTPATIFGGSDGTLQLTISGGTYPYAILWNDSNTDSIRIGLPAGTYWATVTDFNNCSDTASFIIEQPIPFTIDVTATAVNCFNGDDGTATVTVADGTAPFTYLWSNGQTTATINSLVAGVYTVAVTTADGYTLTDSVEVTQPATPVSVESITATTVSCFNGANGTATVSPIGGAGTYTYLWSNGALTPTATGLVAGAYSVTITDANGCSVVAQVQVNQPTLLTVTAAGTNVKCNGGSDGTVSASGSGGTVLYTYAWSNGATSSLLSGLSIGTYSVTITDAKGCTATTAYTVTQPGPQNPIINTANVTCFNAANGSITVTGRGGTAPYEFNINNSGYTSTNTMSGLAPGTYSVLVKDANNCIFSSTVSITQPTELIQSAIVTATCAGSNAGAINITVNGGTPRYSFAWTGPGGFTSTREDITGLAAGTYTLIVTDNNGCTLTRQIAVAALPSISITGVVTPVSCFGGLTGGVNITVNPAGISTYNWSGPNGYGATTEDITGVKAATYTVTVTSFTGCTQTTSFTVTQPAAALTITSVKTDISTCGGAGSIRAIGNGGTRPYQYSKDGIAYQSDSVFANLGVGSYTIRIKDSKGCAATSAVVSIIDNGNDPYEANERQTDAKTVVLNSSTIARIAPTATDKDWFKFTTGLTTVTHTLTLSHISVAYLFDVYDSRGRIIAPTTSTSGLTATKTYAALIPNTVYSIQVRGNLSFSCYSLTVSPPMLARNSGNSNDVKVAAEKVVDKVSATTFPNPHQGSFNFKISSPSNTNATIELFSIQGQKISERKVQVLKGDNIVPYREIKSGTIFYKINIDNKTLSGRIIGL